MSCEHAHNIEACQRSSVNSNLAFFINIFYLNIFKTMKGLGLQHCRKRDWKFETYLITSEFAKTITNFVKEKMLFLPLGFGLAKSFQKLIICHIYFGHSSPYKLTIRKFQNV